MQAIVKLHAHQPEGEPLYSRRSWIIELTIHLVEDTLTESRDNQTRRTARLLEIIQHIAGAPRYWTRQRLAQHYEISERMITKDIEIIRLTLGFQIKSDGAGYYFVRVPHMPTTSFSLPEAIALLTAARTAQAVPGINSGELAIAIARLESIFPEDLRPYLRDILDRLPRSADGTHRQRMLALLHRAYFERTRLRIAYQSTKSESAIQREIEPYEILPYGRSWHVIAYDSHRKDVIQFKCDRIQTGELLDQHYEIPSHFNLEVYLGDGWGMLRDVAQEAEDVILHFDAIAGRWASEEHWHKSQVNELQPDGSFILRFHVGITPETVNWLMYYGERVEVIAPDWLREEVREGHRRAWEVK